MSAPTNLAAVGMYTAAVNFTLTWDPPVGVDIARYEIGFTSDPLIPGSDPPQFFPVGSALTTSFDVTYAPPGARVYVRSVDVDGVEGDWSEPYTVEILETPAEINQVRALIPDLDSSNRLFTDAEIQTFLDIYNGNVRRAAAAAIDAVAVNEALLYKIVRTDDLQVNGVSGAEVLRKRAQGLRQEADSDDALAGDEALIIVYPEVQRIVPEGTPAPYTGNWGRTWIPWG